MYLNQQHPGRPLTKKSYVQAPVLTIEEDEGYGTSPSTVSPQLEKNTFTFVAPSVSTSLTHANTTVEDEWSSLQKDLNKILSIREVQLPKCDPRAKSSTTQQLKSVKVQSKCASNGAFKVFRSAYCQFCAKNGEIRSVVESHILRHPVTRAIICPVLRKYVCELCGATGDNAHTKFYCPQNQSRRSAPMAILLKTTRNNATGKRSSS